MNEYLANGRNGTQAYLKVHPYAKPDSARANAPAILAKASVQAEIAKRVQVDAGVTRESVSAWINDIALRAKRGDRPDIELKAVVELAELAGLKVQRIADVSDEVNKLTPEQRQQRLQQLRTQFPALVPEHDSHN